MSKTLVYTPLLLKLLRSILPPSGGSGRGFLHSFLLPHRGRPGGGRLLFGTILPPSGGSGRGFLHSFLLPHRGRLGGGRLLSLSLFTFLLAACSSGDDAATPVDDGDEYATVSFVINAPKSDDGTRVGDPGQDTGESEEWDQLTLMMVYTTDGGAELPSSKTYVSTTLSKEEFDGLENYYSSGNDNNTKKIEIQMPVGNVYIYGVTYSKDADKEVLEAGIEALKNEANNTNTAEIKAKIEALEISNTYAEKTAAGDTDEQHSDKFMSVATGYYNGLTSTTGGTSSGSAGTAPAVYSIERDKTHDPGTAWPIITLSRLAAKIDIQWDAQDAYDNSYTDVKVEDFTFHNNDATAASNDAGKGRLFPGLVAANATALEGQAIFYNTTAISKRNGRVYHYVFPDGKGMPKITFNITATATGAQTGTTKAYTFDLNQELKPATWYKINTTIRGITGSTTYMMQ